MYKAKLKNLNEPATKGDLHALELRFEDKLNNIDKRFENIDKRFDDLGSQFSIMQDDLAKTLIFLNEHFPIQQHLVRENTDKFENHELRLLKVEDTLNMIVN